MLTWASFRGAASLHNDNGSEFVNATVAKLPDKPLIELTQSRPIGSGDDGLIVDRNGAVACKPIGSMHIDANHADRINDFDRGYLNAYLNYHRPCIQADVAIDTKGRKRASSPGTFPLPVIVPGNDAQMFEHAVMATAMSPASIISRSLRSRICCTATEFWEAGE